MQVVKKLLDFDIGAVGMVLGKGAIRCNKSYTQKDTAQTKEQKKLQVKVA